MLDQDPYAQTWFNIESKILKFSQRQVAVIANEFSHLLLTEWKHRP